MEREPLRILVSPAEKPPVLRALGEFSSLPEKFGADFMWQSPHGLVGVQRKTQMDFIASIRERNSGTGNRLGRELQQMSSLWRAYLIVESPGTYTVEGEMLSKHTRWTLKEQLGAEMTIQEHGIVVLHSRSTTETAVVIEQIFVRSQKEEHVTSLLARPGPQKNGWGKITNKETAIYLLTGIPSVGIELATRIYEAAGRAPLQWSVDEEFFRSIPGIGDKRVRALMEALQ